MLNEPQSLASQCLCISSDIVIGFIGDIPDLNGICEQLLSIPNTSFWFKLGETIHSSTFIDGSIINIKTVNGKAAFHESLLCSLVYQMH